MRQSPSGVPRADSFARKMAALTAEYTAALDLAAASMKRSYDKHHRAAPSLKPGDLVLLDAKRLSTDRPSRKLSDNRLGPFEIVELVGLQSYRLALPPAWKIHDVFHVSKLVPFKRPQFTTQSYSVAAPELVDPVPVISEVLNHKYTRNVTHFLVVLDDQEHHDAAWLPESILSNFADPNDTFATYKASLGL